MNAPNPTCSDAPAIYLYGCGALGRTLYGKLAALGYRNLKGFLDSGRSDQSDLPLPVWQIDAYATQIRRDGDVIVIASSFAAEIQAELTRRGIVNKVIGHGEFLAAHLLGLLERDFEIINDNSADPAYLTPLSIMFIDKVLARAHASLFWGDRLITLDKSNGFLSDPRFRQAFTAIRGKETYDQYGGPHTIAHRLNTLVWAASNALALDGDFVECGVLRGDMSWVVINATDFPQSGKAFYLYDSYEGFSDKYSSPDDFPDNPGFFKFVQENYKNNNFNAVADRFSSWPSVKVIKGFLPDSLSIASPEKIAYLHIDLNSPQAEIGVLDALFERVVSGGFVIFDDYGWQFFRLQKEKEDEFMARHGYRILELPTGQGLVVKR